MADYYFRNTGDVNWGTASNWSLTDGGGATGAVPTSTDNAFLTVNSGNCTLNASNRVCASLNCTGYVNTFAMSTFQLTISASGALTVNSTMTISGTNATGFSVSGSTITTGGHVFQVNLTMAGTCVLGDDLNTNSQIRVSSTVINSNNIRLKDNSSFLSVVNNQTCSGDTTVNIEGDNVNVGANSASLNTGININIIINTTGTVTFNADSNSLTTGGILYSGAFGFGSKTFQYLQGNIIWDCRYVRLISTGTATFDLLNQELPALHSAVNVSLASVGTINISSAGFYFCSSTGGMNATMVSPNISLTANMGASSGTLFLTGSNSYVSGDFNIACNLTVSVPNKLKFLTNARYTTNTFTILSGTIDSNGFVFRVVNNCTFVNINKALFSSIIITAGSILTMNNFFSGSAEIKTRISSTTTTNYTITFTDAFEKIAKFVRVSNCTITDKNLLIITDRGNANAGTTNNIGIRYINSTPNGVPKNSPSVFPSPCYGIEDGFVNDPIIKF